MRKTTKLMLALSLVGSLALTSCKDYTEEDYSEVVLTVNEQLKKDMAAMAQMQQQISDLAARLDAERCQCDGVSITKNADGTYTISDSKGNNVKVSNLQMSGSDADGYYITGSNGQKIYIPQIVSEDGKNYIVIGDSKYEIGQASDITINGNTITIKVGDDTWTFDKTTGGNGGGACSCSIKLTYNAEKGTYTISDGTNPGVEIPAGTVNLDAALTDNGDGTVTVKIGDNETIIKKVESEVSVEKDDAGNDVIVIQKYNANGTKNGEPVRITIPQGSTTPGADLSEILEALYGVEGTASAPKEGSVLYRLNQLEEDKADAAELEAIEKLIYGEGGTAENPVDGSILARLNDLEERVAKLEDALAKLVTGVVVQDVINPAFGSYSSLVTNLQTTMLLAYHGTASQRIDFPTIDPQAECSYWAGDVTLKEGAGNAGSLFVTINPNTVNFNGLRALTLVNSNDDECGVKLEPARKTTADDPALSFGFTRSAEDNGLYEVKATLDKSAVNDSKLNINVNASVFKQTLSDIIKVRALGDLKPVMSDLASVVMETAQAISLDKQGVKCSWEDEYGTHSVYSKYEIAAAAFQPLGFYTVDGIFAEGGQYWRGYDRAKVFIEKQAKNIGSRIVNQIEKQLGLDKISADIDNIIIDSIDYVVVGDDVLKQTFKLDTMLKIRLKVEASVNLDDAFEEIKIPTAFEYDEATGQVVATEFETVKTLKDEDKISITTKITEDNIVEGGAGDANATEITIHFRKEFTVDMSEKFKSVMDGINAGFSDTNDMLEALNTLMNDVQDMIANIRTLESKIENATYLPRVFKYLDKVANAVGKYTPMLFKPALFVNSENGFGLVGGYGAPTTITSTSVTLIPTTYSGELLSPIFKKYIRVNGGQGQLVDGQAVTVNLKKGLNTIEYYALDYQAKQYPEPGNESAGRYYIYVK